MRYEHATEQQLQKYVDDRYRLERPLVDHIEQCDQCQESVAQYQVLFDSLADDNDIQLPADFAATVMARIPVAQSAETIAERWFSSTILGVVGPLLLVAITMYFLGYEWLLIGFDSFATGMVGLFTGLFTAAGEFMLRYGLRADLFGFAALLLLAVGLADRLLHALRHGKAMLMA
jgi:anti-sigma factor RsiW